MLELGGDKLKEPYVASFFLCFTILQLIFLAPAWRRFYLTLTDGKML